MKKPEISNSGTMNPQGQKKMSREELTRHIKRMRDRDSEMVTGIFKNNENPGSGGSRGALQFSYKAYPGDTNEFYEFWDGERYTIPRGVARHINNNCFYREYQHLQGQTGMSGMRTGDNASGKLNAPGMQVAKKIHRFAFLSLEYMDDDADMMPSNLVEVTVSP
jgi:hypothetical protein